MSLPDTTASAALSGAVIKPVWFVYLDVVGDPLRANSSGVDISVTGSGQDDLDGSFVGIDNQLVDISPLKIAPGGSDTMTAKLSGLPDLDDAIRATLANKANWQGRVARLWRMIRDENNVQQGAIQHYYTGYMMALMHSGSPDYLTMELSIESYLAAFSAASNRSYLDQEAFDPLDLSAKAALAIANGNKSSIITGGTGEGNYGGGGGFTPGGNKGDYLRGFHSL